MKKIILCIISVFSAVVVQAQSLIGAWEATSVAKDGQALTHVFVVVEDYQVLTTFVTATGKFMHTNGGSWHVDGDTLYSTFEFNTLHTEQVGTTSRTNVHLTENALNMVDHKLTFKRLDDGTPGALEGAWLMSGRVKDGETQLRDTSGPRKTMKILSGTRFQWIAYNTETKAFMGTGGGTYTTQNGDYVEQIGFFSKDDSRVGQRLQFKYELIDDVWHHSGLSSKGQPIHELWRLRTE
ncbi:conserved hypothetical protein [Formosa agariphila KMM 3901]|uniref:Membrane or secreted protein n=1 Tax=Formosa agariphila (strain DSM 15362 / KCTC 12365 / LMG 23005 / KMM 3901 / M-2Alg 35-1) TaxID=1347342 RepID=T2KLB0_FORAG|nr:hypothetical protein [Formosa agariphila]CDF79530.1 conserved hypothetical protein [Formosa agariphila KMM 3901]